MINTGKNIFTATNDRRLHEERLDHGIAFWIERTHRGSGHDPIHKTGRL